MGILVTVLFGLGVLACFFKPTWALQVFIISLVFRPNEHVEGVLFPVLPALIVTMGVAYLLHINRKLPRPAGASQRNLVLMTAMVGLLVVHLVIWRRDYLTEWILGEAAPLLILVLFATRHASTTPRLHGMFTSLGLGSTLIGGQALAVHFLFKRPAHMITDRFGDSVVSHGKLWDAYHLYENREDPEKYHTRLQGRATGTWGNSNDLAMVCNWGVPVAIYYLRRQGSKLLKLVGAGVMMMLMATIFLTGSRGNQLQLGINLWMIFVGGRRKALGIVLLLIALVGVVVILPQLQPERGDTAASANERTRLLGEAARMFIHNPVKGVGFLNFQDQAFKTLMPHNVYAQCLAETGLIGGLLFLPMIWFLRRDAVRGVKHFEAGGNLSDAMLARCIGSMQFAFLIFMLFTNQFMRFTFGLVIAHGMALFVAALRDREGTAKPGDEQQGEGGRDLQARPVTSPPSAGPAPGRHLTRRGAPELEAHPGERRARYVFDPDAAEDGVQEVDEADRLDPDDLSDLDKDPFGRR